MSTDESGTCVLSQVPLAEPQAILHQGVVVVVDWAKVSEYYEKYVCKGKPVVWG